MNDTTVDMTGELLGIARRVRSRAPIETPGEVMIAVEGGVDGDYHGTERDRQVTAISADAWRDVCRELGTKVPWTMRRANLLLGGIDLRDTAGMVISIGDVRLEIVEQNPPCRVMDIQHDGLRNVLKPAWRAGVTCRVLAGGQVRIGDSVRLLRS